MIKVLVYSIALSLLLLSGWQFYEAFIYGGQSKDWKETNAWVIDQGEGCTTKFVQVAMSQPFVGCVFFDNSQILIYGQHKLPPAWPLPISVIYRNSKSDITKTLLDPNSSTNTTAFARYDSEKNKVEVLTKEGMVIQSTIMGNFNETKLGQEWSELYKEQYDQCLPKVRIKYNPANPAQIVTVPDDLEGGAVLLWSGLTSIISAVVLIAAMKFHESMTNPGDPYELADRR